MNVFELRNKLVGDYATDQLYLALRLASLEHYLSTNEPLPLILDDTLVNFDDRRIQAALRVFADLSRRYLLYPSCPRP